MYYTLFLFGKRVIQTIILYQFNFNINTFYKTIICFLEQNLNFTEIILLRYKDFLSKFFIIFTLQARTFDK